MWLVFLHKGEIFTKHWGKMTQRFPREDDQPSVRTEVCNRPFPHPPEETSAALTLASDFWPTELSCYLPVRSMSEVIPTVIENVALESKQSAWVWIPIYLISGEHLNSISIFPFWKMGLEITSALQFFCGAHKELSTEDCQTFPTPLNCTQHQAQCSVPHRPN